MFLKAAAIGTLGVAILGIGTAFAVGIVVAVIGEVAKEVIDHAKA